MTNNEWRESNHPLRIWITSDTVHRCHPVFAIRFQDRALEYMTTNGHFYTRDDIAFAEYFINGEWSVIKTVPRFKGSDNV